MRILALILSCVLITLAGWVAGFVSSQPPRERFDPVDVLAFFALTAFACGPVAVGWIVAARSDTVLRVSPTPFPLWLKGILCLELAAAVAIAVHTVMVGTPAWVPLLVIAGGAALTVVAFPAGRFLARHQPADTLQAWEPVGRDEVRRIIRSTAVTFAATFLAALAALVLLIAVQGSEIPVMLAVGEAAALALIAASLRCTAITTRLNRRLQQLVNHDRAMMVRIDKVVTRGKRMQLDSHQENVAARYAAVMVVFLPLQTAQASLVLCGVLLFQLVLLAIRGGFSWPELADRPLTVGAVVFITVGMVIFIPLAIRRISRVRRYAREHPDLLPYPSAQPMP